VLLRARDPARFERMRLVLGYYDSPSLFGGKGASSPAAASKTHGGPPPPPPPPPPRHATLSLLQTLWFTPDVDPYYKMALLSYRTRPLNRAVAEAALPRAEALLAAVAEEAGAFVPRGGGGGRAAHRAGAAAGVGGGGGARGDGAAGGAAGH